MSMMEEGNSEETDYRFHHLIYDTWKQMPPLKMDMFKKGKLEQNLTVWSLMLILHSSAELNPLMDLPQHEQLCY